MHLKKLYLIISLIDANLCHDDRLIAVAKLFPQRQKFPIWFDSEKLLSMCQIERRFSLIKYHGN